MDRKITISRIGESEPYSDLIPRLRNFGEDLYRQFAADNHAEILLEEIDAATSELRVLINRKRQARTVSAIVRKTLQKHRLDDKFSVSQNF